MARSGVSLQLNFSSTNNHGVVQNNIQRDTPATLPTLADFIDEVTKLSGGTCLNISTVRYDLTEAEKTTKLVVCLPRYARNKVSGTMWNSANPDFTLGFFLSGLGPWVGPLEVETFVKAHGKMPDGTAIDSVFVGAFKKVE